MLIVLRKKIIKRYLVLALSLMFLGRLLVYSVPTQAAELFPELSATELRNAGFSDNELKSMGFVNGIGKVIIYQAKQKQIWNARVEKARENVEVAKRMHKKPNARDLYLIERDEQIKNPPKKPFVEKWFGAQASQMIAYFKTGKQPPDAKIVFGEGMTLAGLLMLVKILAPLGI